MLTAFALALTLAAAPPLQERHTPTDEVKAKVVTALKAAPDQRLVMLDNASKFAARKKDKIGEAFTLVTLGHEIWKVNNDSAKSIEKLEAALELYGRANDIDGQADALAMMTFVYLSDGRFAKAIEVGRHALVFTMKSDKRAQELGLYLNLGSAYSSLGEYEQAIPLLSQALELAKSAGNKRDVLNAEVSLGSATFEIGDYAAAKLHFLSAVEIENRLASSDPEGQTRAGLSYLNLAIVEQRLGETEKAQEHYVAAEKAAAAMKDWRLVAQSQLNKAVCISGSKSGSRLANLDAAIRSGGEAAATAERAGDRALVGRCYLTSATFHFDKAGLLENSDPLKRESLETGAELAESAASEFSELSDFRSEAAARQLLGTMNFDNGYQEEGIQGLEDVVELLIKVPDFSAAEAAQSLLNDYRHKAGYRDFFGLFVGINKYSSQMEEIKAGLQGAVNDALDLSAAFKARLGVPEGSAQVLLDERGTRAAISARLADIRSKCRPEDTVLFFFSGFGYHSSGAGDNNNVASIVTYDGTNESLGIPVTQLATMFESMPSRNTVVVIDGCYAGKGLRSFDKLAEPQDLGLSPRNILFIAPNDLETEVGKEHKNGSLTLVLLDALKTCRTAKELANYIHGLSAEDLERIGVSQSVTSAANITATLIGEDFPLGPVTPRKVEKARLYTIRPVDPQERIGPTPEDKFQSELAKAVSRVLVVGTNNYADPNSKLTNPIPDAQAILKTLTEDYNFEALDPLYDKTFEDFVAALRKLKEATWGPYDQLVLYIAGHAVYDDFNRDAFLMFSNSKKDDIGLEKYMQFTRLRNILDGIGCQRILVVLDTCHAAAFDLHSLDFAKNKDREETLPGVDPKSPYKVLDPGKAIGRLMRDKTRQIFAASAKPENTVKDGEFEHSPFAWTLLDLLKRYSRAVPFVTPEMLKYPMLGLEEKPLVSHFGRSDPGSEFVFVVRKK